jgi:cysteine desulfurase/selenocysteine lyase
VTRLRGGAIEHRPLPRCPEEEVVFTSGTTSAINLLAHSFGALLAPGDEVMLSALEHHSNLVPWQPLAMRRGVVLRFLPMTPDGRLDLEALASELTERCRLVALTHCSNVTGAVTDVARVVQAAHEIGAKIMLDGAQRAPHGPLDVRALDVDFYVFSGHKTYRPTGIGVLWGRRELLEAMPPFMTGGQMIEEVTLSGATFRSPPRRFEAGTPPIGPAIGLGAAIEWMATLDWHPARTHELRLTRRLIDGLIALPGVRLYGPSMSWIGEASCRFLSGAFLPLACIWSQWCLPCVQCRGGCGYFARRRGTTRTQYIDYVRRGCGHGKLPDNQCPVSRAPNAPRVRRVSGDPSK